MTEGSDGVTEGVTEGSGGYDGELSGFSASDSTSGVVSYERKCLNSSFMKKVIRHYIVSGTLNQENKCGSTAMIALDVLKPLE